MNRNHDRGTPDREDPAFPQDSRTPATGWNDRPGDGPDRAGEDDTAGAILVEGARTHNLKGIDVAIPRNSIVVFAGVSGSGKSSLVFDTIHTEAQRQLVETFSSFARRRLPKLSRPPVDSIRNLSTSILIDQKPMGTTMRSTVGTATEIATYLRMLYSRFALPFVGPSFCFSFNNPEGMCLSCSGLGKRITVDEDLFLDRSRSLRHGAITHPDCKVGGYLWREYVECGLFDSDLPLASWSREDLDRLLHAESIPFEVRHGAGMVRKNFQGLIRRLEKYYANRADEETGEGGQDAYSRYLRYGVCPSCAGRRLNPRALEPMIAGLDIAGASSLEIRDFPGFLDGVDTESPGAGMLTGKMRGIARHLVDIGAGYLSLERGVATLSGGESQRVKMARQLDCDLTGLTYVMDEPTTGLHPGDTKMLLAMLRDLRRRGNTVLVVEHDPEVVAAADWVVEIGPGAGGAGGNLVYSGPRAELAGRDTPTGQVLADLVPPPRAGSGTAPDTGGDAATGTGVYEDPAVPGRRKPSGWYLIEKASANNLRSVDAAIPKGVVTCVTGVSGSGKSSLVLDVFAKEHPEAIVVDQAPVGRTSRGSCASYIGAFDLIRKEIAAATGFEASLFSFNSRGACPGCSGSGFVAIEMSFLDDVRMTCEACGGDRFKPEVLAIEYRGKNIARILDMTAPEAAEFFASRDLRGKLKILSEVGLDYLSIGQSLSSLSGGEAQRLKLATELGKSGNIYILDEPTSGLHVRDTGRLLSILDRLADAGNTVIVIEHNPVVMARADWIIDMGPGGGAAGGLILAAGPPGEVARNPASVTGPWIAGRLSSPAKPGIRDPQVERSGGRAGRA